MTKQTQKKKAKRESRAAASGVGTKRAPRTQQSSTDTTPDSSRLIQAPAAEAGAPIVVSLESLAAESRTLNVALSNELIELLSTQMYQSPVKAIEELVVNAYDADARVCKVYIPPSSTAEKFIAVYDDGSGMDYEGLVDLWHIGRSRKRSEEIERRLGRKLIGKFGIGKLATYTIARFITYITKRDAEIRYVSLDFRQFKASAEGPAERIELAVRRITDVSALQSNEYFVKVCTSLGVKPTDLTTTSARSWTLCVLDELKDKAMLMKPGHLKWVLSTAMPLSTGFSLHLNDHEIVSSKKAEKALVRFSISAINPKRLKSLRKPSDSSGGEDWRVQKGALVSSKFPMGVKGEVLVTESSLYGGKSADLERSHGFFVRVRDRLINETDPLFGLHPLSYEIWNRFRADVYADDLDKGLVAPREGIAEIPEMVEFRRLLAELFYEARDRYNEVRTDQETRQIHRKEHEREYVAPRLVERPVADVLSGGDIESSGAEPDRTWFYLKVPPGTDISKLIQGLYAGRSSLYRFSYSAMGRDQRLAVFDPAAAEFTLNADHELVREFAPDPRAAELLADLVCAETLLEVYLREHRVSPQVAGDILQRRDVLFRSLAKDHPYSVAAIASALRDSKAIERDLEMAVIAAARALGFVAKHVSGDGEPDGLAEFNDYQGAPKIITLEAKASAAVPTLANLDMAGLAEHVKRNKADGCLLVSCAYPGATRGEDSAVAQRASQLRISCWTVADLARVVQVAEARHIAAKQILDIVLTTFAPNDVARAINSLLSTPSWEMRELYGAVIDALRSLEKRLPGSQRNATMVAAEVSREAQFKDISLPEVERALRDVAHSSQGALTMTGDDVVLVHASLDEIDRRIHQLTAKPAEARRMSTFRERK